MKRVFRLMMSIFGSILLSMLASLALRRLLLWSSAGGEEQGDKRLTPVLVVMPVVAGNQWVFGQPRQLTKPTEADSTT